MKKNILLSLLLSCVLFTNNFAMQQIEPIQRKRGSQEAGLFDIKKLIQKDKQESQKQIDKFAQLPDELLLKIFKDLSVKDIIRISQTCERFRKLLYSNPITHEIVNRILEIELVSKRSEKLAPRQGDADLNDFIAVATELERKFPQLHKSLEALAKKLLIDSGYQLDKIDMEKIEMQPGDLFTQKFMEEYTTHCVGSCKPDFWEFLWHTIIHRTSTQEDINYINRSRTRKFIWAEAIIIEGILFVLRNQEINKAVQKISPGFNLLPRLDLLPKLTPKFIELISLVSFMVKSPKINNIALIRIMKIINFLFYKQFEY